MKVLLTGSYGFIGSNVANALLASGIPQNDILLLGQNSSESHIQSIAVQADVILHLGAFVDTMKQDVNKAFELNFQRSKWLFDAARKDTRIIYASSAACFGNEGDQPSNLYGWSKYTAEQYGLAKKNNFVALRFFNVYGPGEENKGSMASVAYQAMTKGKFSLFPGENKRDFIYVFDVVNAVLHARDYEVPPGVYQVGTGTARSYEDMLNILGIPFDYTDATDVPVGFQTFTQANPKQFMPGWQPRFSLETGMTEYRHYFKIKGAFIPHHEGGGFLPPIL